MTRQPVDPDNPKLCVECINCGSGTWLGVWCDDCLDDQRKKTHFDEYEISQGLFDAYADTYSADTASNDYIRGTFTFDGKLMYNQGGRWSSFIACILIPEEEWDGPKYTYAECSKMNGTGGMHHSNYHRVRHGKQWYVVKPYHFVKFRPIPEEEQISMF